MKKNVMKRRSFLGKAAASAAGLAASVIASSPAIGAATMEWKMVTAWPKNFPGLGSGARLLADLIGKASGGRLTVKVFGAGEIVPAFEAIDAVASGAVEMGHGAPYYWKGKSPACQFISSLPFGLTAQEQNAWMQFGGGQELADEAYKQLGCKFFVSGNSGAQMGGWFNKEVASLDDFKGLKMRIPGLGGEVIKAAGGNVVNLPGGEIPSALMSGAIDAAEWVGPYNDLAFGLYKNAKYYYFPGWHEPASILDNFINLKAWESLPGDLKAIIEMANAAVTQMVLSEFSARNNQALAALLEQHKVNLKKFPDPVLEGLGALTGQVLNDLASDQLSRKILDSQLQFRQNAISWAERSEHAFVTARAHLKNTP